MYVKQCLLGLVLTYVVYRAWAYFTIGASRRAIIREKGCLPVKRYPCKDPIFGLDMFKKTVVAAREKRVLQFHIDRFEEMKAHTIAFPSLGREILFTMEPENLKTFMALNFKQFSLPKRRLTVFGPLLGRGIFTTDGAEWQHSRTLLRPNFHRDQVGDLDTFEVHVGHLKDAIPRDGSTVDLQDLFFRLTMDSATEFLFGESTNCLAPGTGTVSNARFSEAWNHVLETIAADARWGKFGAFFPRKQFRKDIRFIHEFVDYYVDKGIANRDAPSTEKSTKSGRYIFIDELVQQTHDPVRIRSELLNILLAGRDTTASLLSNVWWTLSKRPDIWKKLQEELAVLAGQPPSYDQLKEFKYLRAILNESLRLYPVVPANAREAVVDTTLPLGGGPDGRAPIFVPKGQVVTWSAYAMHRRKDFYGEDSEDFRPERWLGDKGLRPGWEYLPFNGGPRICIGQQFALTEASYTTIRLCQEFSNIETRDSDPWREWLTLTCVGGGGCKVVLTPS